MKFNYVFKLSNKLAETFPYQPPFLTQYFANEFNQKKLTNS